MLNAFSIAIDLEYVDNELPNAFSIKVDLELI